MKTAADAFIWAAGTVSSRSQEIPAAPRYAVALRGLADLCKTIPCELPEPYVIGYAFTITGKDDGVPDESPEASRRMLWREIGTRLMERAPAQPAATAVYPEVLTAKPKPAPLLEAIWLWQMMMVAAERQISALPEVKQDPQGQLLINNGKLLVPISPVEFQRIQHDFNRLAIIAQGLKLELQLLIQQICPDRYETLRIAEKAQVEAMQAKEMEAQRLITTAKA